MRLFRNFLVGLGLLAIVAVGWRVARQVEAPARGEKISSAAPRGTSASVTTSVQRQPQVAPQSAERSDAAVFSLSTEARATLRRLAYAQAWNEPQPPALAAFHDWSERYRQAANRDDRNALEAEGIALARERRPVMRQLIVDDPQRALAVTVPAVVRQNLPASVLAELETRVAGKGDYAIVGGSSAEEGEPAGPAIHRIAFIGGVTYTAHSYGRRADQLTKENISLHGVALDNELALHDSPVRVLEPGEMISTPATNTECPVSKLLVAPIAAAAVANTSELDVAAADGRIWEFCGTMANMAASFEQQLIARDSDGAPKTAAEVTTAWTIGTKKVLVIRVDFSDLPGEPVDVATAQSVMDNDVKPFFENASYGQTTLVTTVSSKVYRLPSTAASYATTSNIYQLNTDARAAAGGDYSMAAFDRIIVSMAKVGPSQIPGSQITYSGQADITGTRVWIYGSFKLTTVAHELGHTYGLWHGNIWQVTDGNPLSSSGTSVEYGDPFDIMGHSNNGDVFNPWSLNRLGWLPDSAVTQVTKSGTYRIYRFDGKNISLQQPLALRIARDGVRNYWIGYRQAIQANASISNGAYIFWGFNTPQQSQLLDCTTPGVSGADAALAVGATLDDSAYGIKITPVARGGSEPAQYLDVQVTLSGSFQQNYIKVFGTGTPDFTPPVDLGEVKAFAAGEFRCAALKMDGSVVTWGSSVQGKASTASLTDLGDVVALAAGWDTAGVVRRDGTVRVWGDNPDGTQNVPAGLTGVRELVLWPSTALAIKTDGTVVAWGNGTKQIPSDAHDIVSAVVTPYGVYALKADGTVVQWPNSAKSPGPAVPAGLNQVVRLAAGSNHILALKADGTVVAWRGQDSNNYGQADVPAGLTGVSAIAAAGYLSVALKADGSVTTWGQNFGGSNVITQPLAPCRAIAASTAHTIVLVGSMPVLSSQPDNQTATVGGNVTFTANATSAGSASYQWRKNGTAIIGATSTTLTLNNVQPGDTGIYTMTVSDGGSFVTSNPASLLVSGGSAGAPTSDPNARLANLSTRAVVGTGADILIPGIAITGTGQKQLIIRASGPALAAQGVAGALAKPQLRFYSGSNLVAENIGWSSGGAANTNALLAAFAQVGLPAFPNGSADCALIATVGPGIYTATISGVGETTGASLVEVYELGASGARLTALSCRARVGTGGDVLIPGITIAGSGTKRVIIRASGPALTDQGVGGVLAKPFLEIYGESGKITENAGWSSASNVTDLMLATAAVGLAPFAPGSADCAVLLTLSPGNYTAKVSGLNNTTGVALVEVYEAP